MVLLAICQPPRKLTHRQIMALSLRDVSKIMAVTPPPSLPFPHRGALHFPSMFSTLLRSTSACGMEALSIPLACVHPCRISLHTAWPPDRRILAEEVIVKGNLWTDDSSLYRSWWCGWKTA